MRKIEKIPYIRFLYIVVASFTVGYAIICVIILIIGNADAVAFTPFNRIVAIIYLSITIPLLLYNGLKTRKHIHDTEVTK